VASNDQKDVGVLSIMARVEALQVSGVARHVRTASPYAPEGAALRLASPQWPTSGRRFGHHSANRWAASDRLPEVSNRRLFKYHLADADCRKAHRN
jgi:hypothetical protein